MSKKRWVFFILILIFAILLTFKLTPYINYWNDYVYLMNIEQDLSKDLEQFKEEDDYIEDKRIYIGICFPDRMVNTNQEAMKIAADNLIIFKDEKSFKYIGLEKRFGYHVYVFHPIIKKQLAFK